MMSKKHFIAIADILHDHKDCLCEDVVSRLMVLFSEDNPRFNPSRFRKAISGE